MAGENTSTQPIDRQPFEGPQTARPFLIVLRGSGRGVAIPVCQGLQIGRAPTCDLRLLDEGISRHHASMQQTAEGNWEIVDLKSRNGLFVRGERVAEAIVQDGDLIELGETTTLRFTHRDELEQRVFEGQRLEALGRLAGGIAHDFNNLLAVISTATEYSETTALRHPELKDCVEALRDVLEATHQARELTTRLLDFSRGGDAVRTRCKVSTLVDAVQTLARRTFTPIHPVVATVVDDVYLQCDRGRMEQVLLNIMLNARDAMEEGGTIRIASEFVESGHETLAVNERDQGCDWAVVRVIDEGVGMGPLELSRAFEPFFTTKSQGKGTGLGLAMAYGIVQRHGGRITLDSARGKGTTVSIWLPATHETKTAHSSGFVDIPTPLLHTRDVDEGGSILLVDDDRRVRKSTARLLRQLGKTVEIAEGGKRAIELLEERRDDFGMVLLDLVMPGMSGRETLDVLHRRWPELPVYVCSGYEVDDAEELRAAGASAFIRKPFTSDELFLAIRQLDLLDV